MTISKHWLDIFETKCLNYLASCGDFYFVKEFVMSLWMDGSVNTVPRVSRESSQNGRNGGAMRTKCRGHTGLCVLIMQKADVELISGG
ncbi:TPA: hypothetical protein DDZ10_03960 [Candidatus Uhrbacteria bacterium]|nr:MAG: hypothetical protein A3D69_02535 [Candidatus Uhrbacteria bacterium RIFCSPHIGHO2_02_FULL_54_11]HBL39795.1 hypothetical protein [Candidatus Uhrbacteria bacterium]